MVMVVIIIYDCWCCYYWWLGDPCEFMLWTVL